MNAAAIRLFRRWRAGLAIDEIWLPDEVFSARDEQGRRYLIAHTAGTTWLCAPISERALDCVRSGRAELRAAFAHSSTGMVEQLTVSAASVCQESMVPCDELTDEVLPRFGTRLCWQAACA